jgi:hypothetical protein
MFVRMVEVRRVRVVVLRRRMVVTVRVLSLDGWIVHVVVMAVVVPMRVFVVDFGVAMPMSVPLGEVQPDPHYEADCADSGQGPCRPVAGEPRHRAA